MKASLSGSVEINLAKETLKQERGIVYLVQSLDTGLFKIGFTEHLQPRMTNLRNQNAGPIRLMGQMKNATRADEKAAQDLFGNAAGCSWDHSEWFKLSPEILEQMFQRGFFERVK